MRSSMSSRTGRGLIGGNTSEPIRARVLSKWPERGEGGGGAAGYQVSGGVSAWAMVILAAYLGEVENKER